MIRVTCDRCGKAYQVPLEKLRKAVHSATCTRCGNKFSVHRPADALPPSPPSPRVDSDLGGAITTAPEAQASPLANRVAAPEGMVLVPAFTLRSAFERAPLAISAFFLEVTPVTNGQYQRFVDETRAAPPLQWSGRRPATHLLNHPVVDVPLDAARAYARWRRRRLPTDLEWQAAARGPDNRRFPWGNGWELERCVGPHSGADGPVGVDDPRDGMSPCGCRHLVGNVWEWTEPDPRSAPPERGYAWVFGGSHRHPCDVNGEIARNSVSAANSYSYLGFRCASDL